MTRTPTGSMRRDSRAGNHKPPRLAEWLLSRALPPGKRGDSIRGDLLQEFSQLLDDEPKGSSIARRWYWQQSIRLSLRYLFSDASQPRLQYPRSSGMWFDISNDLKSAFRNLQRAPGTSALIVLTLAFAIGAATIGFTFADFALLRGLPVDDTSRVVSVFVTDPQGSNPRARISAPDFLDYVARSTTLEKLAVMRDGREALIRNGQSQTLNVTYASADLFASMGQAPLLGRAFMAGDDRPGAPPVALLAHRYWQAEFDRRPSVLGSTLQIGREHYTVVGVLSPAMEFGNLGETEVWLPLRISPDAPRDQRNLRFLARLREGVTFEQAAAEMAALGDALAGEHPRTNGGWTTRLAPVNDLIGGESFWVVLALFMLSIALLMAVATANVSNLVMVRTLARARELAVRTALGARKGRIVRQFITEGLVLSALAALLSVPVAWAGLEALIRISGEPIFRQLQIDVHEVSFVAVLALICPLLFSISPVRTLSRPNLRHVLAAGGRGVSASTRARAVLVVVQVALAVILLTVSSLSFRSIRQLYAAPIGLETTNLLIFGLDFNDAMYPSVAAARAAALGARDKLLEVAGVESLAMLDTLPVLGDRAPLALTIDNETAEANQARPMAFVTATSGSADRTLGLRMLSGQWWTDGARGVAVVSEAAARRYFGGVDEAVGRFITFSQENTLARRRVIGVSSDVANTDRTSAPPARVWVPLDDATRAFTYVVRAHNNPGALMSQVRTVVAAQAAAVPIEGLSTFDDALSRAAASDYAVLAMLGMFAVLALVLATTGLFGVVSYGVAQRTAEFGTRMALGARSADVVRLVARESVWLLTIGLTIGLTGGVGIGTAMKALLFGLSPADPLTLASVSGLLVLVTFVATALPAWKASRIDPVIALRTE
jgi:predicted permease